MNTRERGRREVSRKEERENTAASYEFISHPETTIASVCTGQLRLRYFTTSRRTITVREACEERLWAGMYGEEKKTERLSSLEKILAEIRYPRKSIRRSNLIAGALGGTVGVLTEAQPDRLR